MVGKCSHYVSRHARYGIENEEEAVKKFKQQIILNGHQCTASECGLFVEEPRGILAATPDRLANIDGEEVFIEVKCLSASRDLPYTELRADILSGKSSLEGKNKTSLMVICLLTCFLLTLY